MTGSPALARPQRRWPPYCGTIIDRRGNVVEVVGMRWRLNDAVTPVVIDWSTFGLPEGDALDACRSYIAHLVKHYSTSTASNAFKRIQHFTGTAAFVEAASSNAGIPFLAFSQAKDKLGTRNQWQLHDARALYRWCVGQRLPGFNREVLARVEKWTFGGNPKGRAVRSSDTKEGPLTRQEVASIMLALKAGRVGRTLPVEEQAAIALCLATGSNAGQYASMREEDVQRIYQDDVAAFHILSVPRHKKQLDYYRAEFRKRRIGSLFGEILQDLVSLNQATHHATDNLSRPLFRRAQPRREQRNDGVEWRYHVSRGDFTLLLQRAIRSLGVLGRDGEPLHVTTRRFRYTKGTTMMRNGASKAAVADALDHSDLQNVEVYWNIDSDIVELLDKAMAFALAPRAQALAGIVRREGDAVRGNDMSSRRYVADKGSGLFEPVGTCGSFSFCNILAPLACYTCVNFQAWMDGPHEEVLDLLLAARRDRVDRGLDAKMVAIEDEIITAVAGVITRIRRMRGESAAND